MKNTPKAYHGKNDLEILCLRCIDYCKEHKDTIVMSVLICILILVIIFFASTFFKGNFSANQDQLDDAFHASSSSSAIALPVAPDPAPFETIKATATDKNSKRDLLLATADLYMRRGIYDLQMNMVETPVNPEKPNEKAAKANPNQSFDKAIACYNEAMSIQAKRQNYNNTILQARALYSIGVTWEYLASIAKNADEVKKCLNLANTSYKNATQTGNSPYRKPAEERINELAKIAVINFYTSVADKYNKALTAKPEKSILPNGTDKPVDAAKKDSAKDSKTIDEFSIKADAPATAAPKAEVKKEAPKAEVKKEAPKAEPTKEAPKAENNTAPKADAKKEAK